MELSLLLIFFLVPYILAIVGIDFSPAQVFINWGANVAGHIVGSLDTLFRTL
jgi:hypothetical protein